jgi:hypothetical protein
LLDLSHLSPGDLIAHELRFELTEKIQPTRTIDRFRVSNRVRRSGNQVDETDVSRISAGTTTNVV